MSKGYKKFSRFGLVGFAILVSFLPIFNPLQIFTSLQNYSFDSFQRILPPMTQSWLKEAINSKEEPELTSENLRHFKLASSYIYWTYQNALREYLRGRKSIHVFTDLMNSVNFLDLPRKTHKKYLKKVTNFVKDQ